MKKQIAIQENSLIRRKGDVWTLKADRETCTFLTLETSPDLFTGAKYLTVDLRSHVMTNDGFWVMFTDRDGETLKMDVKLFPGVPAVLVFDLKYTDGSLLFPPLWPGTLKAFVAGRGLRLSEVTRMEMGLIPGYQDERRYEIREIALTDELPDFPRAKETTVDVLGQWKQKDWPGKTKSVAELNERLQRELQNPPEPMAGRDRFGGCTDLNLGGTGWFRTEKKDGRWYLVDPDGGAFFSTGVFGVYPGEAGWIRGVESNFDELPDPQGPCREAWSQAADHELYRRKFSGMFPDETPLYAPATANLIRALGENWYDGWCRLTAARLRHWGINTLSMFSDPEFVRRSKMPYVIMLKGFPETGKQIFRDFPDVFSEEYRALSRKFASQLSSVKDDPMLIGYFLNNEPTWGFVRNVNLAQKLLENGEGTETLEELKRTLKEKYGTIDRLNVAWGCGLADFDSLGRDLSLYRVSDRSEAAKADLEAFTCRMVEAYAAIPAEEAGKVDPHHLNLGMRFASEVNESFFLTAKYFDVFSFNCYHMSPLESLKKWNSELDMPMLIGEFHFGALDAGLPSPSLVEVASQEARGEAYSNYVRDIATFPCGVGAHYFAYNDQPVWGRYDGENYQFGFIDICSVPYVPFVNGIREENLKLYEQMK